MGGLRGRSVDQKVADITLRAIAPIVVRSAPSRDDTLGRTSRADLYLP